MLEESLNANTAALTRLADLMEKNGTAAPAAATAATRPPGRPRTVTLDMVKAAGKKLSDEKGRPVVAALVKQHVPAGADVQYASIDASKYAAFIAAAEVLLAQAAEPEAEADDGL